LEKNSGMKSKEAATSNDSKKKRIPLSMSAIMSEYEKLTDKDKKELDLRSQERKKQDNLVYQLQIRSQARLRNSSLTESELLQCSFDKMIILDQNRKQINQLKEWDPQTTNKGIILSGSVGTGKSWACKAIINKFYSEDFPCKFVTFSKLLDYIRTSYSDNQGLSQVGKAHSELTKVMESRLLVLDDLGAEKSQSEVNSWAYEQLFILINDRVESDDYLFITTNLSGKELKDRYGHRVLDRILGSSRAFKFEGESFRQLNNDNDVW